MIHQNPLNWCQDTVPFLSRIPNVPAKKGGIRVISISFIMSSTELEVDITKTVPKLKGNSNFSIWVDSIEITIKAKDSIYWNILRGSSLLQPISLHRL